MTPLLQGELSTGDVRVCVAQADWETPTIGATVCGENRLLLFLPPVTFRGEIRAPAAGMNRFTPISPNYFWPADVVMESHGSGGRTRYLRHSFTQARLQRTMDDAIVWRPEELERGLDLRHAGVAPLMLRMLREVLSPGLASEVLVDALSTALIVDVVRHLRGAPREDDRHRQLDPRQFSAIRDRIAAEDLPPPRVAELAKLCGVGDRHLLRLFRATTGETVSGFIRKAQTERARRLLSETKLPMKEIAYRLGFSDASSFAASFRKTTCDTPASYRDRTRIRSYATQGAAISRTIST